MTAHEQAQTRGLRLLVGLALAELAGLWWLAQ